MSAVNAPFGFVAARHPTGECRAVAYTILPGYASAIYKGMPVILNTDGTINAGTAAADLLGVFAGVEYVGADGKPVVETFWPAGGVPGATNVRAWVYDDPAIEFLVQADGSVPQAAIGAQSDISNVGNNANGRSTATLSSALAAAAAQAQFRVTSFDLSLDNVPGDAYTKVFVKIARHQYVANKVGI
jgi:hypothetical protein